MKTNLHDVSFIIAVRIDSSSRMQNLDIAVRYLLHHFDTNILVLEMDEEQRSSDFVRKNTTYTFISDSSPVFHHTWINNELITRCHTPFAVIYDTDVIVPAVQLRQCVERLRTGEYAFALPYDGRFVQVDYYNKRLFAQQQDIQFLIAGEKCFNVDTNNSVGGSFVFDIATYRECGWDNENIQGWGHEDAERIKRLQILGYPIYRPPGVIYHLWHERNQNSFFFDEARELNSFEIYFKTCSMNKETLTSAVQTWTWTQTHKSSVV